MERLDVKQIREIVYRLRQGQSERQVAADLGMSRVTIHKYYMMALDQGYMDNEGELPTDRELVGKLGPWVAPPWMESTVAPYGEVVEEVMSRTRGRGADVLIDSAEVGRHGRATADADQDPRPGWDGGHAQRATAGRHNRPGVEGDRGRRLPGLRPPRLRDSHSDDRREGDRGGAGGFPTCFPWSGGTRRWIWRRWVRPR